MDINGKQAHLYVYVRVFVHVCISVYLCKLIRLVWIVVNNACACVYVSK